MNPVTVLLIDPDKLMREGLKVLLNGSLFSICHEAADLPTAEKLLQNGTVPDLIVIEISHRPDETLRRVSTLQSLAPSAKIVVLTGTADRRMLMRAMERGVSGVLLKDISAEALIRSLHLAILGERIFPIHIDLLRASDEPLAPAEVVETPNTLKLSTREKTILTYLTSGHSNKLIARTLSLTEATVKAHVKAIMRKVNAQNRTQAALWGMANGLERKKIDPDAIREDSHVAL